MHVIKNTHAALKESHRHSFYMTGNLLGLTFPQMQHLYTGRGGGGVLMSTDNSSQNSLGH